ncbi:MAG: tRNA (adenosine(37)-N6)-dimethylallyltransferase MiaA [Chloroflexota bacterium]|nr:tRNA (adenosine(37)-N6)-dimethylallyltransferase MiaA [Chloroflexota bacterium]
MPDACAMKYLVAIVGPTATGKSAFALRLAGGLTGAVIISADSRQVYRGLDIGTAKPTAEERGRVRHELIDVVDADQSFSLANYQRLAYQAIDRAEKPFLVGGTGLYLQAVLDGFVLPAAPPDPELRSSDLPTAELLERLRALDPAAAEGIDAANRRRLLRALERAGRGQPARWPRYRDLRIGLTAPREVLYRRSDQRVDSMLEQGWLDEVRALLRHYPPGLPALTGLGYSELAEHVSGRLSLAEAVDLVKRRTRQFIKRQLTWFRRDQRIHWFDVTQPGWIAQAIELLGTVWRLER